jgi:hypothetical protein
MGGIPEIFANLRCSVNTLQRDPPVQAPDTWSCRPQPNGWAWLQASPSPLTIMGNDVFASVTFSEAGVCVRPKCNTKAQDSECLGNYGFLLTATDVGERRRRRDKFPDQDLADPRSGEAGEVVYDNASRVCSVRNNACQ